jgi:glycerol-3-phosphate dehydrogenase
VELSLNEEILSIRRDDEGYMLTTNRREIPTRFVINCAGIYSDKIAAMVHKPHFSIHPRSGEYILCNRDTGKLLNKVAFQMPSAMGKGILVTPTVHGNLLIGPDAINVEGADRSTHPDRLTNIFKQALLTTPDLDPKWFLRSFAGIRAVSSTDDFIIEESESPGFFHAAGIQSPGLTSSPAIADLMVELLEKAGCPLEEDPSYDPIRKPLPSLENRLSAAEVKERLEISGSEQIICRCEQVPRAVIEEALKRSIPINSVDAIKRRTRASMGACQGGFCRGRFLKVVKEMTGKDLDPRTDIEKEGVQRVGRAEFLEYYKKHG